MKRICILIILLCTFVACSTANKNAVDLKTVNVEPGSDLNLILEKVKTEEAEILAPAAYKLAQEKHQDYIKDNKNDVNGVVGLYQEALKKVEAVKQSIPDLLVARIDAIKVGANLETLQFKDAEEDLLDITTDLEAKGKLNKSKSEKLTLKYRSIELTLIKDKYLKESKKSLDECLKLGGMELAPKTMKEAKTYYNEVHALIEKDRYNDKVIEPRSKEAQFMAQRALSIILDIKKMNTESKEETVLRYEKLFENISKTLEIADIRNKSFFEQQEEINEYIHSLFKAGRNINVEKTQMNEQLTSLKEVVGELSKKEKIRNIITDVQKELTLSEAEIYQQEERLIIRLTGLKFVSGQADLNEDHQIFLAKVGEVIKKLGKSVVIVEGHTDALGNETVNQELSTTRANVVRDFLISKTYLANDLSSSAGFGDTRPIASNKTALGRSQNRRVDLVITILEL